MSNFQCPHCGMVNIDCEKEGFKTPKELEYEKALKEIEKATKINCEEICGRKFEDCNDTSCFSAELLGIVNKAKGGEDEHN